MNIMSRMRSAAQQHISPTTVASHGTAASLEAGQELAELSLEQRTHASLYGDLDSTRREIRLLRQQVPSPGEEGMMSFELAVHSLETVPAYKALSYCWGTEDASRHILINGRQFAIRPNVHDYLQLVSGEAQPRWMYIDAICINQSDLLEKSSQVRLMGDIYRQAKEVVAWLGATISKVEKSINMHENDEAWQLFFDMAMLKLVPAGLQLPGAGRAEPCLDQDALNTWLDASFPAPNMALFVLDPILNCPYWSRLWIVQEMLLARVFTIRYKRLNIPWRVLYGLLRYCAFDGDNSEALQNAGRQFSVGQYPGQFGELTNAWRVTWLLTEKATRTSQARAGRIMLNDAVRHDAGQHCSRLLDKLYGTYGLLAPLGTSKVDYTSTFRLITYAMIQGLTEIRSVAEITGDWKRFAIDAHSFICVLLIALGEDLYSIEYTVPVKSVCKCFGLAFSDTSIFWARHIHVHTSIDTRPANARSLYGSAQRWFQRAVLPTLSVKYNAFSTGLDEALEMFDSDAAATQYELDASVLATRVGLAHFFDFDALLGQSKLLAFHLQSNKEPRRLAEDHLKLVKQFPIPQGAVRLAEAGKDVLVGAIAPIYYASDSLSRELLGIYTDFHNQLDDLISEIKAESQDPYQQQDARHLVAVADGRRLAVALAGARWFPGFQKECPIETDPSEALEEALYNPLWLDERARRQHPEWTETQVHALKSLFLRHEHEFSDEWIADARMDMYFEVGTGELRSKHPTGARFRGIRQIEQWYSKLRGGHEKMD